MIHFHAINVTNDLVKLCDIIDMHFVKGLVFLSIANQRVALLLRLRIFGSTVE